jgi:transposase
MSLKPFSASVVPERTASVARRAFPAGSLYIRIFDELGTIFHDQDFADLYSQHGQPGQPPFRLALVTVLQFIEGLSNRGAADAVRGRIDWKYLLCLELDDRMIRVLTIQYYANFAPGYLKAERNESCSTKYYRRCVIRSW